MSEIIFQHESSYTSLNLTSLIHRNRLANIRLLFEEFTRDATSWADFGCSNGFIIEQLSRARNPAFSQIDGYDYQQLLLESAQKKNIPGASFYLTDLNNDLEVRRTYDLVTCFETLEHVGNYRTAFHSIFKHLGENAVLIVAVPVETGLVGLLKFAGRLLIRKDPYKGFFENRRSQLRYSLSLLSHGDIERFRTPPRLGWGPHLGFDHENFFAFVENQYLFPGKLKLLRRVKTTAFTNILYVFQKR